MDHINCRHKFEYQTSCSPSRTITLTILTSHSMCNTQYTMNFISKQDGEFNIYQHFMVHSNINRQSDISIKKRAFYNYHLNLSEIGGHYRNNDSRRQSKSNFLSTPTLQVFVQAGYTNPFECIFYILVCLYYCSILCLRLIHNLLCGSLLVLY